MRFAIVSDLHSNLQAWNAVLLDIRSQRLDRIICLGDIVGYGPNPAEVLHSVHANVNHLVLGNHDAVVCGKMDDALFNESARQIIDWTRGRLNREARRFLGSLPLSLDAGQFRCAHGDFSEPGAFHYVIEPEDALLSWQAVGHRILFVGHTHVPGIFLLGPSGLPHRIPPQDFEMEDGKRYLVNVGSVGQPRDGEARACYCVFDSESGDVLWRRIPFDLDRYREALRQTGVSEYASYFLRHDPREETPPLRDLLNFSPARTPEQSARDAVEVQELVDLQNKVRCWKRRCWIALASGALALAAVGAAWYRHSQRALDIPPGAASVTAAQEAAAGQNLLPRPESAVRPGESIPGWSVHLGHRRKQAVALVLDAGEPVLILNSQTARDFMSVSSEWVPVQPGMKIPYGAMIRKKDGFSGSLIVAVSLRRAGGDAARETELFAVKEPNQKRKDDWLLAEDTVERVPADATAMRLVLRGQFIGRVECRACTLCRR